MIPSIIFWAAVAVDHLPARLQEIHRTYWGCHSLSKQSQEIKCIPVTTDNEVDALIQLKSLGEILDDSSNTNSR